MTTMSGRQAAACSTAVRASPASPTTSNPSSCANLALNASRISS